MKAILYPHDGHLALTPGIADEDANRIALLVTPINVPFLIVDQSEIPADHTYFNAWTADFSQPSGVGVGPEAYHQMYPPRNDARLSPAECKMPPAPPEPDVDED